MDHQIFPQDYSRSNMLNFKLFVIDLLKRTVHLIGIDCLYQVFKVFLNHAPLIYLRISLSSECGVDSFMYPPYHNLKNMMI